MGEMASTVEMRIREQEECLRTLNESLQEQYRARAQEIRAHEFRIAELIKQASAERAATVQVFDKRIQDITEEKFQASRNLELTKASIAPIGWLPPEMLASVFHHHVANGGSPWKLATVNHTWRTVTFDTRGLWTRILVDPRSSSDRWRAGRMACATDSSLKAALARAGMLDLDVKWSIQNPYLTAVSEILASHSAKLQRLHLEFPADTYARTPFNATFGALSALVTLVIHFPTYKYDWMQPLLTSVDENAPLLRNLYLWQALDVYVADRKWWSKLEELRLTTNRTYPTRTNRDHLVEGLKSCQNLQELELETDFPLISNKESATADPTPLSSLTIAMLSGIPTTFFTYFTAPRLTHLLIRSFVDFNIPSGSRGTVHLPSLRYLHVIAPRLDVLGLFQAPALDKLVVLGTVASQTLDSSEAVSRIWDGSQHMLSPVRISLGIVNATGKALLDAIGRMTRLELLNLPSLCVSRALTQGLQALAADGTLPAPSLRAMQLEVTKGRVDEHALMTDLSAMVARRGGEGHPLSVLVSQGPKDLGIVLGPPRTQWPDWSWDSSREEMQAA